MKSMLRLSAVVAIVATLASCSFRTDSKKTTESNEQPVQSVQVQTPVKIPTTKEIVTTLCSDEFEGRLIGTKGNEKAGEYISKVFKDIGLTPMVEDNYYAPYTQEVSKKYGLIDYNEDKPENKTVNNVVGVIRGKDSKSAVVISAHFDHIGYVDGKIIRGALDNTSGLSALIKIAHTLKEKSKEKPFDTDIVICAFNGEEEALAGSRAFVNELKSKSIYKSLYNINIDSIGAKAGGTLALKNKSKVSDSLYASMKTTLKKDNVEFADTAVKGASDHMSFESANIPNILFIQEGIEKLVHKPTDTPDILNYEQIDKIANAISDFVEINDEVMFN